MMRVYVDDYKLVIPKAWPETIRFNFITKANNSLKHEIDSKTNWIFSETNTKNNIEGLLFKYKHGNNIYDHGKR